LRIFAQINDSLTPIMGLTWSTIDNHVFYVPSSETWRIVGSENGIYKLFKDGMNGIAPIEPLTDPKSLFTICKHYGPWDGNKCLTYGNYSYE
jgi:hypothetical protein